MMTVIQVRAGMSTVNDKNNISENNQIAQGFQSLLDTLTSINNTAHQLKVSDFITFAERHQERLNAFLLQAHTPGVANLVKSTTILSQHIHCNMKANAGAADSVQADLCLLSDALVDLQLSILPQDHCTLEKVAEKINPETRRIMHQLKTPSKQLEARTAAEVERTEERMAKELSRSSKKIGKAFMRLSERAYF